MRTSGSICNAGFLGNSPRRASCRETRRSATGRSRPQNSGADIGKTKRGRGTKLMVLADGRGVPLGVRIAPASPAEAKLIESTLEQVAVPRSGSGRPRTKPLRLIYDKAADSDALRLRLKKRGIDLICPHRSNRKNPRSKIGVRYAVTAAAGPSKGQWPGSETSADGSSDKSASPRCSWPS